MNSVHSTDGLNYSYSKVINAGIADVELSDEEKNFASVKMTECT